MKKAFTLIELLVVIAIIAILAAILFPVFAQAKSAAKKTQSLSNIKNQSTGVLLYTTDSDDLYPQSEQGCDNNGTQQQWYATVHPYIKNGQTGQSNIGVFQAWGQGGIWNDPMHPDAGNVNGQGQHYGINKDIAPSNYCPAVGAQIGVPLSTTSFDNIADKVLIMNKCKNGHFWNYPYLGSEEWYWTPWTAPSGGIPTRDGSEIASGTLPRDYGGFLNFEGSGAQNAWQLPGSEVGQCPRFRYNGVALAGFADGHAAAIKRNQLGWWRNIAVRNNTLWHWQQSWYPY